MTHEIVNKNRASRARLASKSGKAPGVTKVNNVALASIDNNTMNRTKVG